MTSPQEQINKTQQSCTHMAEHFINALQQLETNRLDDPIVALFSSEAKLQSIGNKRTFEGQEGARRFWQSYLHDFQGVHSRFIRVLSGERHAVLEWESSGEFESKKPLFYKGITLLEFEDGKINYFRTYFDTAAFLSLH